MLLLKIANRILIQIIDHKPLIMVLNRAKVIDLLLLDAMIRHKVARLFLTRVASRINKVESQETHQILFAVEET